MQWAPAIKDQGEEGSCTAHAWTSNAEFLFKKYEGLSVNLSPSFVYYQERAQEGSLDQGDCGAQVVTGANVMDLQGAPTIAQEPYTSGEFQTAPTAEQVAEAHHWRTGAYHRLSTVTDIKECIVSGYPIVIGFTVYESFEGIGADGLMPMPAAGEAILGGHCMFGGLAYDDSVACRGAATGAVLMQNSWGPGWALDGCVWMPYSYLADADVVSDIFIQHLGRAWR